MQVNHDDLTAPILDRPVPCEPESARSGGRHHLPDETIEPTISDESDNSAAWAMLVILGCAIVTAMLILMVLWR